jgi:hypothetical protein
VAFALREASLASFRAAAQALDVQSAARACQIALCVLRFMIPFLTQFSALAKAGVAVSQISFSFKS